MRGNESKWKIYYSRVLFEQIEETTNRQLAYLARAIAFLEIDRLQSSIIDLQIIFSLDPNCDKAYKLRAKICIRLKEYDRAIAYEKGRSLFEQNYLRCPRKHDRLIV